MNEKESEVMDILQEECAEVIQAVSKIRRFGVDSKHPEGGPTNLEHLEIEIGDVIAMIEIMNEFKMIDMTKVQIATLNKKEKLKKWSNIYVRN